MEKFKLNQSSSAFPLWGPEVSLNNLSKIIHWTFSNFLASKGGNPAVYAIWISRATYLSYPVRKLWVMDARGDFGRLFLPSVGCSRSTPRQRERSDPSSSCDAEAFSILSHTLFSTWSRININPTWHVWLPLKTRHLSSYKDPEKSQAAISSVLPGASLVLSISS